MSSVTGGGQPADRFGEILREARRVATVSESRSLEELGARLRRGRLRVLVGGEAKRGKSTLVNALLGRPLLPTGVAPLTAVTTTVTRVAAHEAEDVVVSFRSGATRRVGLDELAAWVTEPGNPGNGAGVDSVTVRVSSRLLDAYPVDLIDTPGTGSVYAHNTADARRALSSLDAAVLVLTADPPISAAERELLVEIDRRSVRTFVLLNKSDRLAPDEVEEAARFTREVCLEATGHPVVVQPCSARAGEAEPGFAAFRAALDGYLRGRAVADLDVALGGHLARALTGMLEARQVHRRALELAAAGQQRRVEELRARLAAVSARRGEVGDRCTASLTRLRQRLDTSAAQVVPPTVRAYRQELAAQWESHLSALAPDVVEDRSRQAVESFLTGTVEAWHQNQAQLLEAGLAEVVEQAEHDVATQVRLARDVVRDVFDLDLGRTEYRPDLQVDTACTFDFSRPQGWDPPLRGVASRVGTAAHRRRRARQRVVDEIAGLTDRQVGRARADLQRRLDEAGRAIRRPLEEHLSHAVDAFALALRESQAEASPSSSRARRIEMVSEEVERLEQLLSQLQQT